MDIVLVYFGLSIFGDTVPKAHKKVNEHEAVNELNDHESINELNEHDDDPFKRYTRCMDHVKFQSPIFCMSRWSCHKAQMQTKEKET